MINSMSNIEETCQATEDVLADIEMLEVQAEQPMDGSIHCCRDPSCSISSCSISSCSIPPCPPTPPTIPPSCEPSRHTNLDSAHPLTLTEKLRLNCIFYLRPLRILRYLVTLCCIAWTVVSIRSLWHGYLKHRTNAIVHYTSPNWTYPPAISICTECLLCPYATANLSLPKDVYLPDLLENNQIISLLYGKATVTDDRRVPQVDMQIDCVFNNFTMSSSENQFEKNCSEFTSMITSMSGGNKCHTFFSDIDGQLSSGKNREELKMIFDNAPTIKLRISGQWLYAPYSSAYLLVHAGVIQPAIVTSRWYPLESGKHIDFRFGKEEWHTPGPPHKPLCFVYRKGVQLPEEIDNQGVFSDVLGTPDGRPLYRSKYECYQYCMWRQLYRNGSVNLFVDMTAEFLYRIEALYKRRHQTRVQLFSNGTQEANQIPNPDFHIKFRPLAHESVYEQKTADKKCLELCVRSCEIDIFLDAVVQVADYALDETAAYVSIQWAPQPVIFISYSEELDLPQVIGYVGGHLHVWLSLSALGVIGYLVRRIGEWQAVPWNRCVWLCKGTTQ